MGFFPCDSNAISIGLSSSSPAHINRSSAKYYHIDLTDDRTCITVPLLSGIPQMSNNTQDGTPPKINDT